MLCDCRWVAMDGRRAALLAALLVVASACSSVARREKEPLPAEGSGDVGDFFADYAAFARDPHRLRSSLESSRMLFPAALFAGAGLLQIGGVDRRSREELGELVGGSEDAAALKSDIGLLALTGTAFVLPQLLPPRDLGVKRKALFVTSFETWVLTLGATEGVRALNVRRRPNGVRGGFFSGHASHSFWAATLLEREYGLRVGLPAYAVATAVGYFRVKARRHFPADILVGAGVGTLIANLVYDKNLGGQGYFRRRRSVEVTPLFDNDRAGIMLRIRW